MENRGNFPKTEILYAFALLACSVGGLAAWEVFSTSFPYVWADAEAERVAAATGVDADSIRSEMTHSFARGIAGIRASVWGFWGIAILLQLAFIGHMWFYGSARLGQKPSQHDAQQHS